MKVISLGLPKISALCSFARSPLQGALVVLVVVVVVVVVGGRVVTYHLYVRDDGGGGCRYVAVYSYRSA